jgi:hypothetical protein
MSSSTYNNNQNINPRSCIYGCGIQIYWNTSVNEYWEAFTKKKYICPNRSTNNKYQSSVTSPSNAPKHYYYNNTRKASFSASSPNPKMSNLFEYLEGSIAEIQKKYETLSDIVTEYNGKVHGSQTKRDPKTGHIDLLVYYELPQNEREEVKRKFENFVRTLVKIY